MKVEEPAQEALAGDVLPHQIGDQQAEQQFTLDRGEADRGPGLFPERFEALAGPRDFASFARDHARLFAPATATAQR